MPEKNGCGPRDLLPSFFQITKFILLLWIWVCSIAPRRQHRVVWTVTVIFTTSLCFISDPTWASINRGVLICDECCSVHRSLGRHISQVRSLKKGHWSPTLYSVSTTLCYSDTKFQCLSRKLKTLKIIWGPQQKVVTTYTQFCAWLNCRRMRTDIESPVMPYNRKSPKTFDLLHKDISHDYFVPYTVLDWIIIVFIFTGSSRLGLLS